MAKVKKEKYKGPVRAITVTIAEVVDGGTKNEFYTDLRKSLRLARDAANKCMSRHIQEDANLFEGGPMPEKWTTYGVISEEFPGVCKVADNIKQDVKSKYEKYRGKIRCGMSAVPLFKSYPWPLTFGTQLRNFTDKDGRIEATIVLCSGKTYRVVIKQGKGWARQMKILKYCIANNLIGTSKILLSKDHVAILRVACRVPAEQRRELNGELEVRTAIDKFAYALKDDSDVPFVINGDDLRRWLAERGRRYQRLREDRKADRVVRRRVNEQLKFLSQTFQNRIHTFLHQTSAAIVNHAKRRRYAKLTFNSCVRSYVPSFPWYEFKTMLENKCSLAGIEFVHVGVNYTEPDTDYPHVYFIYSPGDGSVKIGKTTRNGKERLAELQTGRPDALYIAAINAEGKELSKVERRMHQYFKDYRQGFETVTTKTGKKQKRKSEWFTGEPVITCLREIGLLANTGNLSQIRQFLDVPEVTSSEGHLQADGDSLHQFVTGEVLAECVLSVRDNSTYGDAPEVTEAS